MSKALRFQANLPKKFYGDCILTATYLINKLPTKVLSWKTPYEVMFGEASDYSGLRNFGCLCYAYNMNIHKDKFDSRARKCIFIGYPSGQKAYKLYDLENHTTLVSRDVVYSLNILFLSTHLTQSQVYKPGLVNFNTENEFCAQNNYEIPNSVSSLSLSHNSSHNETSNSFHILDSTAQNN